MFYDVYCALCEKNGLTPSGAASKIGFNRASVTVWKNTGKCEKTGIDFGNAGRMTIKRHDS